MRSIIHIGIDAGSTTIKGVVTDEKNKLLYKDYRRHFADITGNLQKMLCEIMEKTGDCMAELCITGSAGMGIAERYGIPFVQEVVASCEVIRQCHPEIKTMVDIGGEDSKMIFFREGKSPDIRMNGSCAGGTGSFIDQMIAIMNVDMNEFSRLAGKAETIYPIASRCGVFSKTDVQNLLARNVAKADIAASVFHAVSMQVVASLSRGYNIEPKLFLCGGPFTFIPSLRKAFMGEVSLTPEDIVVSENSEVVPAWGAALVANKQANAKSVSEYLSLFKETEHAAPAIYSLHFLKPLFTDKAEWDEWKKSKEKFKLPRIDLRRLKTANCFIGIDSGSTTTKIVAIDEKGNIFFNYYAKNEGLSLQAAETSLKKFLNETDEAGLKMKVLGSCVTGYGEDLVKNAFNLDTGIVETIAHYIGSYHFNKEVSFILDIGGQDMKAAYIENGIIKRIEINEACSSGCGSFIETFAKSLNYSVPDFAAIALQSKHPCDLGTRCTVFMNSKVKQAQREGAAVTDISAGLGYSVVKNCLIKVLKIKDKKELGDHIMVQGGTFRNPAIIRALENELGKEVMVTDYPELMGAYGAALDARRKFQNGQTMPVSLAEMSHPQKYACRKLICQGCENNCTVNRFTFENGNRFHSGNKCEKIFSSKGGKLAKGVNMQEEKYDRLFHRSDLKEAGLTLGIPRVLGMFENYPFWHTLFKRCGINAVLSDKSTMKLYEKGIGTVMADNICFPAKLVHGHIYNLAEKNIDRIFMPYVVYEHKEDKNTINSFNCPIVTGYSDVIKSAVNPEAKFGIPIDTPTFTFANKRLMKKACKEYLRRLMPGMSAGIIDEAFAQALEVQKEYERTLTCRAQEIVDRAVREKRLVILLAGRPYHIDALIQHKIADMITGFGADVITEDIVRYREADPEQVQSVMQWAYTNRIIKAAMWVAGEAPQNVHYVQITSFGCGPDAFIVNEITDILRRAGKNATFLKVDDINNIGSMRLRIRSLIESLRFRNGTEGRRQSISVHTPPFERKDRQRTILAPWFGDFYSPFIPAAGELAGYKIENMPPSDCLSVEYGLKYSNNEICYPATLVVGDLMKAVESGKYNRNEIALGITQTGGQCRATNYVALIKKALIAAGYEDIPVVTISSSSKLNKQPGFKLRMEKYIDVIFVSMIYADCLSQFYHSTAPRESQKGEAEKLKGKYIDLGIQTLRENNAKNFFRLAEMASNEFSAVNNRKDIPQIGIVGEIYVKYNDFGHKHIVKWLIEQGVEPVVPPLSKFFIANIASNVARVQGNIKPQVIPRFTLNLLKDIVYKIIRKMESCITKYPYYIPFSNVFDDAKNASKIINLNAQFGEGWRIAAEFTEFVRHNINNVVSLQPFGCIANHVISKGIEKRAREVFPSLNLLFLDFDSGMSEVNIFNRLHFMIENARKEKRTETAYYSR